MSELIEGENLKLDKKLPKIILPEDKYNMLIDWYNRDLRFQDTIPEVFPEGYLILQTSKHNVDINKFSEFFKATARVLNTTYRVIENRFKEYLSALQDNFTVHFKFDGNKLRLKLYDYRGKQMSEISCKTGKGVSEMCSYESFMETIVMKCNSWDEILNNFNNLACILFACTMWYLATTTNLTKYYYENKVPVVTSRHKKQREVPKFKFVSTPIYDLNKIRRVKVDHLIKRREGFTYSHSFQVKGHYRHYKDGKVIFVKSFIKGENKTFQPQVMIVNPKNIE